MSAKLKTNVLNKKIKELQSRIVADKNFSKTPAATIAEHFKLRLKQDGYTLRRPQWERTMLWAKRVLTDADYSHISIQDWLACIDWCFSPVRRASTFWSRVKFTSFKTCVSAYNDFNDWRKKQSVETAVITYGKK